MPQLVHIQTEFALATASMVICLGPTWTNAHCLIMLWEPMNYTTILTCFHWMIWDASSYAIIPFHTRKNMGTCESKNDNTCETHAYKQSANVLIFVTYSRFHHRSRRRNIIFVVKMDSIVIQAPKLMRKLATHLIWIR